MIKIWEIEVKFKPNMTVRDWQFLTKCYANLENEKTEYGQMEMSNDLMFLFIVEIDGVKDKLQIEKYVLDGKLTMDDHAELVEATTKYFDEVQKKKI